MGQLAKQAQEIQQAGGSRTFSDLVKACAPQLQSVMPKGFKAERLTQMAIAAYKTTPKLSECSVPSILSCCLQCATLGLEPSAVDGMGRAYILPYFNGRTKSMDAQFILGKNGMLELVRRSGEVSSVRTQGVYEGDDYEYWEDESGVHFNYKPNLDADHGKDHFKLVYLTAHLKDGGFVFLAMSKREVEAIEGRSKAAKFGPWKTDWEAMAEKTVIRRAFNRGMLPRSVEVARVVAQDESTPVVLDEDGYQVFGAMPDATEVQTVPEGVDPETGEALGTAEPAPVAE